MGVEKGEMGKTAQGLQTAMWCEEILWDSVQCWGEGVGGSCETTAGRSGGLVHDCRRGMGLVCD